MQLTIESRQGQERLKSREKVSPTCCDAGVGNSDYKNNHVSHYKYTYN